MKIRNVAIIAHVDHGKTTLVDALLRQSKTKLGKEFTTQAEKRAKLALFLRAIARNEKITFAAEELNKVKECLIGNLKLSLELSDDIANFYGGQELLKRKIEKAEEKIKKISEEVYLGISPEPYSLEEYNKASQNEFLYQEIIRKGKIIPV